MARMLTHFKINSFVLKRKRVVKVLSLLALKSCGGSQIIIVNLYSRRNKGRPVENCDQFAQIHHSTGDFHNPLPSRSQN